MRGAAACRKFQVTRIPAGFVCTCLALADPLRRTTPSLAQAMKFHLVDTAATVGYLLSIKTEGYRRSSPRTDRQLMAWQSSRTRVKVIS